MKNNKTDFFVKNKCILIDFLLKEISYSKKKIKQFIKNKMVYVNNKIITNSNLELKINDKVTFYYNKQEKNIYDIKIIYEDNDIIVINKPAGLLSISNDKEKTETAFYLVSDYLKNKNPKSKLFVVHRLDQDTSGILIFAKNLNIKEKLQNSWNEIVKTREYTCVVEGIIKESGTIKTYLTMNHFQKGYSTKNEEIGKLAITNYNPIKTNNNLTLVKVNILTGRRNQIRIHMSEMNHPIVGDKKYGCTNNSIKRLALHASKLELIDPRTNKLISFTTEVPKVILSLIK